MNALADALAKRDDAPFPHGPDTEVFVPESPLAGLSGKYETRRTGGEGIVSLQELGAAIYGEAAVPIDERAWFDYREGEVVTGFSVPGRALVRGIISGAPFCTVKRTPTMYPLGQTTGPTSVNGEKRQYRTDQTTVCSYIGSLWVAVEYPWQDRTMRTHVPLQYATRSSVAEHATPQTAVPTLVLGEAQVANALSRFRS